MNVRPSSEDRWSLRYRRWARRLLPEEFVGRWQEEMLDAFEHDLASTQSPGSRRRFLARALVGLLATALVLQLRRWGLSRPLRPVAVRHGAPDRRGGDRWSGAVELGRVVRRLRARPGFALAAIATLTLGIGANTAIFSVVNHALLAPLPFPEAERMAVVYNAPNGVEPGFAAGSEVHYQALVDQAMEGTGEQLEAVAALAPAQLNVGGAEAPERLTGARVTASFFAVAGVGPRLGRSFTAGEDRPGGAPVVVVSDRLWQRRWGGQRHVLGRTVDIDGESHQVLGVMPPGFELLWSGVDVWLPLRVDPARFDATTSTNNNRLLVVRARETPALAAATLPALVERVRELYPAAVGEDHAFHLVPLSEHLRRDRRPALLMLLGAVALVLLIACANLASLFLVRCHARSAELSVRAALGAGRRRLTAELLTESLVLSVLGAVSGIMLALLSMEVVRPLAPAGVPLPAPGHLDLRVLLFTALVTASTVLLFGLTPALGAARRAATGALGDDRRVAGALASGARRLLVAAEVAVAVVLLVGSGLLVHSLWRLAHVDPGFSMSERMIADLTLGTRGQSDQQQMVASWRRLGEEVAALPAVRSASFVQWVPLRGSVNWGFEVEGRTDEDILFADYNLVAPGAFEALGIPILEGRDFEWLDARAETAAPIVVSAALASRLWPAGDALGQRLNFDVGERVWREVVGVVGEVRNRSLAEPGRGLVYFPPIRLPFAHPGAMTLVVEQGEGSSTPLATQLRELVHRVDPAAPLGTVAPLETVVRDSLQERRFLMLLLSLFAGTAILLTATGLHGALAYSLAQRRREIGVRMALGASRAKVLGLIAGQTGVMVVLGLVSGWLVSLLATRALTAYLYEIDAGDTPTYLTVAVLVVAMATAAAWAPARRATAVDPVEALRSE